MSTARPGGAAATVAAIGALALLTLGTALGRSGRLTYHEAFVAQGAREMLAGGDGLVPTIGGRPWLEKPPLAHWLVATAGWAAGRVDEGVARLPSAVAAAALALGVATLASRRFGPGVGRLAGRRAGDLGLDGDARAVGRGRHPPGLPGLLGGGGAGRGQGGPKGRGGLAVGLLRAARGDGPGQGDRLRGRARRGDGGPGPGLGPRPGGAAGAWPRPGGGSWRRSSPCPWPVLVLLRHPEALGLWVLHVVDRLSARPAHFAGERGWSYALSPLVQVLPWTPLALVGAGPSLARAVRGRGGIDRLLWAWAVVPTALLSLATVKNAHYLIHALPPWSIWGALGLVRLGDRLRGRGWSEARVRRLGVAGFLGGGLICALGFGLLGPLFDRRGEEWAFYEDAGRLLGPGEPLALLYDDWDRAPYATPFGPVPHDLAVRLFYLDHPACWRLTPEELAGRPPAPRPSAFAVIGRDPRRAGAAGARPGRAGRPGPGPARPIGPSACSGSGPRPIRSRPGPARRTARRASRPASVSAWGRGCRTPGTGWRRGAGACRIPGRRAGPASVRVAAGAGAGAVTGAGAGALPPASRWVRTHSSSRAMSAGPSSSVLPSGVDRGGGHGDHLAAIGALAVRRRVLRADLQATAAGAGEADDALGRRRRRRRGGPAPGPCTGGRRPARSRHRGTSRIWPHRQVARGHGRHSRGEYPTGMAPSSHPSGKLAMGDSARSGAGPGSGAGAGRGAAYRPVGGAGGRRGGAPQGVQGMTAFMLPDRNLRGRA
jgi:hypothetical protein